MKQNDLKLQYNINLMEAGLDEAGRGCLAGPVVAAAVILPPGFDHPGINDSKQLSESKREEMREIILKEATAWGIGIVQVGRIDKINILNASIEAMHIAVSKLNVKPEYLLVDGNRFKKHSIPHLCIVKGDGKFMNIAAASILAKTHRDGIMKKLHSEYPEYHWDKNKGYATALHRAAILENGITPHHRKSFTLYAPLTLFD